MKLWDSICNLMDLGTFDKACFDDEDIKEAEVKIKRDKKGRMTRQATIVDTNGHKFEIGTF